MKERREDEARKKMGEIFFPTEHSDELLEPLEVDDIISKNVLREYDRFAVPDAVPVIGGLVFYKGSNKLYYCIPGCKDMQAGTIAVQLLRAWEEGWF